MSSACVFAPKHFVPFAQGISSVSGIESGALVSAEIIHVVLACLCGGYGSIPCCFASSRCCQCMVPGVAYPIIVPDCVSCALSVACHTHALQSFDLIHSRSRVQQ